MRQGFKIALCAMTLVLLVGLGVAAPEDPPDAAGVAGSDGSFAPAMDRVKSVIRNYVAARLLKSPIEIDVKAVTPILSERMVSPADHLEVRQGPKPEEGRGLIGRSTFLISVKRRDGRESNHWVSAEVSVVRKVLVAARPIKRKEKISADAVLVLTIAQTELAQQYVETPEELWGKQASRLILPAVPITFDMVEEAPVIRRGDPVTLMVETQGVRIATTGRAKEDGFLGQSLAVVAAGWNKTVYGTVINPSTVKVEF